ncbi:hypothetical protein BgAZ_502750 [Babesia gibsoni]|uniref:ATP-dependent RNA helicase n=1 Tax=Babesia gibsoni TaxID=33632 RepID=A0AAD8LIB3_BABGI|nr:hypothetical protein BgAZ_502750 [Babesia gibsoni]
MTPIRAAKALVRHQRAATGHVCARSERCVTLFHADVRIWGSSLIEYKPRLSPLAIRKASAIFERRFKRVKLLSNGRRVSPNGIQLSSLQPQLAGRDLFIAAPHHTGKTLLYLLPEAIRRAYKSNECNRYLTYKTLVLVPTLDLVLLGSRNASGALRQTSNVKALYYKDILDGSYKDVISSGDVIYTTPHCALKVMLNAPNLFEDVKLLILDDAHRLLHAQSSSKVMRLKAMLKPDIQTVVLAPRNDNILRQLVSRALRVDMRVISFCPEYDGAEVTQHIWGPQRSKSFELIKQLNINNECNVMPLTPLEQKVKNKRKEIVEHCRSREVVLHSSYRCEYLLYEPFNICKLLHAVLNKGTKTMIFFPTVRMAQFCYVYFKHLVGVNRALYALHGGLSPEKRRFTIDVFSTLPEGVLFCTDISSLGLNLGDIDLVVQVGAPESVGVLADRTAICKRHSKESKSILLLHDLDAHALYEAAELNCDIKPTEDDFYKHLSFEVNNKWVENKCYLASCELMYRSLIGYYCNNASRLKFQRWQVPSLVYELVRSFGFSDSFSVTKQFASRLQLWDAPSLVIDNKTTRKTELQAAAAGYPGFRSRMLQSSSGITDGILLK